MTAVVEIPDDDEFREGVLAFLEATLPRKGAHVPSTATGVERAREYQRQLFDAGYAGITWPRAFGGRELPGRYQRIFDREAAAFRRPPGVLDIGLGMAGPTILVHGTEDQKQAFIPPMLRGDQVWCELFSEPGAGSDLASVQMRARRDGDTWLLEGQKVWTSGAQHSDVGACLARTNPDCPKREGITMFVVDMHAPGVTVRPLRQMTGDAQFSEVFLDGVAVSNDCMVGEVNGGWAAARTMLGFERQTLGAMGSGGGGGGSGRGGIAALIAEAKERDLLSRAEVRQRLAGLRIRQMVLRHLGGYLEANRRAGRSAGGEASLLKLAMAQLMQDVADAAVEIAGPAAVAWEASDANGARWSAQLLNAPSASIGGGTNEIVRNVIAERVLGLPRDIEVDLDVPFRDLRVGTQRER